jgi:hypothetical protein
MKKEVKKQPIFGKANFKELKIITEKLSDLSAIGERQDICNADMYEIIRLVKDFHENPIVKNLYKAEEHLTSHLITRVFK